LLFHALNYFQLPFLLDPFLIEILQPHHVFHLLMKISIKGFMLVSFLVLTGNFLGFETFD
jgi:hypothetical protein